MLKLVIAGVEWFTNLKHPVCCISAKLNLSKRQQYLQIFTDQNLVSYLMRQCRPRMSENKIP